MALNLVTMGRRLAEARVNCGITQEQAAEALGVPRTAIVHMEAGNRQISTLELAQLAKLYNRPVAEFFSAEPEPASDPLVAIGRIAPGIANDPRTSQAIRRYFDLCHEGLQLEALLGRKSRTGPPAFETAAPRHYAHAMEQGHRAAEHERRRLGLGDAPIADLCQLIAEEGIWCVGAYLPTGFSGLFLHHPSVGMAILVKHDDPMPRKRFSFAHEYAHALFDRQLEVTLTGPDNSKDFIEKRANAFAAAFLMPKAGVAAELEKLGKGRPSRQTLVAFDERSEVGETAERRSAPGSQEISLKDVAELARHFIVSYKAVCYRLLELDYVNKKDLNDLLEKEPFGRRYLEDILGTNCLWKTQDSADYRSELVSQIVPLAVEAFGRELISRGKLLDLAKKLGIEGQNLIDIATHV